MIEIIKHDEPQENLVSIEEALHAYGVMQLLKEEIERMEEDAQKYYKIADEALEDNLRFKSNYYRVHGNVLMERVVNLKQIMEC